MSSCLTINDINDTIKYSVALNFFDKSISNIVKTSLEVDPEYCKQIKRDMEITEDGNLVINYSSSAINLKPMKKSINSMLDNLSLILETINQFEPK